MCQMLKYVTRQDRSIQSQDRVPQVIEYSESSSGKVSVQDPVAP